MRWSDTVKDYYDVHPQPRWGHGRPVHPGLLSVIEKRRGDYADTLLGMGRFRQMLQTIPFGQEDALPGVPFWRNTWFSVLDAASLACFLAARRPKKYLEIGSGFSTMFSRFAIGCHGTGTNLTSIDPQPRAAIDRLCDRVIRTRLEDTDLAIFDELERGDILFFDGSHRVFENSDATVFFLEVLPRLRPGVLVHIHDIFLPADYTPRWNERLYSEQYLLAAMLLCETRPFEIVLPNYFVCTDPALRVHVEALLGGDGAQPDIPMFYGNGREMPGVSFWLETGLSRR